MSEWAINRWRNIPTQVTSPFENFNLKLLYLPRNTTLSADIVSQPPLCFGGICDSVNRGSEDFLVNHR